MLSELLYVDDLFMMSESMGSGIHPEINQSQGFKVFFVKTKLMVKGGIAKDDFYKIMFAYYCSLV